MNYKICKFCKRNIPIKANKCQYCGKTVKVDTIVIVILAVAAWFILILGGLFIIGSKNDNSYVKDTESIAEVTTIEQTQAENELQTEVTTSADDLTEMEYKANCKELYYDDVFFGKENLKGQYVKIHIYFSEHKLLTMDNLYSDTMSSIIKEHELKRDFFECCVLRKGTDSYVGRQIEVFFTSKYQLSYSDYKTGQKAIIYGKVIQSATNTMDGYNQMWVVPKYVDMEN